MYQQACSFIYEDDKGYIWIGTHNGLMRYDGQYVKSFRHDPLDSLSINNNITSYIAEDTHKMMWIYTSEGLSKLDRSALTFHNYIRNAPSFIRSNLSPSDFPRADKNGHIFASDYTGHTLKIYNQQTDKFDKINIVHKKDEYESKPMLDSTLIGVLSSLQNDGTMYLQSIRGIWQFDPETYKTSRVCKESKYAPQALYKDHTGRLWAGYWEGGLTVIDEKTKKEKYIVKPVERSKLATNKAIIGYISEFKDEHDKYWILATERSTGSIIIVDPVTEKYVYQHIDLEGEITPGIIPGQILISSDGKIYVTSAQGLLVAEPQKQYIQNVYTYKLGQPTDVFYDNLVRAGTQTDDGSYIFALLEYNGIQFYDNNLRLKKTIKKYWFNSRWHDLDVRSFEKIGPNKYLISGNTGLAILDGENIRPIYYRSRAQNDYNNKAILCRNTLQKDKSRFWVRMLSGEIKVYDISTNTFVATYEYSDRAKTKSLGSIRDLKYDNTGKLWVHNHHELFFYDEDKDTFIPYIISVKLENINFIAFDSKGYLWICGENGLVQIDVKNKTEKSFTVKDGISNKYFQKILFDTNGEMWVKSLQQISKFNYETKKFSDISSFDGLPLSIQEYDAAIFIDKDNNLIAGNSGVISKIDIDKFSRLKHPKPTIDINQVEGVSRNITILKDKNGRKNVTLDFKDFPVNIIVSMIDFTNKNTRKYYYRYINVSDSTWYECKNGIIPINTIKPGRYSIQTKGSVNSDEYSTIDTITFTILPKWNQTWWFHYFGSLGLVSLVFALIKWRLNTIKDKEVQETQIQRLAAEQYRNQLELSQITNYFSNSLKDINNENDVLWDVARNLIGKLNYVDCMIYLWNEDKTKLIQKAGYGPKGSIEEIGKLLFDVKLGQGVVGYVAQYRESVLIHDTRLDTRYRVDEMERLSEICVPIINENELIGVIDCEHHDVNHYTENDVQILQTIASNISSKFKEIANKKELDINKLELASTMESLKSAQLDALRSQMNPHFIFNSLNSIENFILKNEKIIASEYLGKFSKLIRNILDNSKTEKIPLTKEIETLQLYIELERIRTNESFDVIYNISQNILDDNIMIPPMLMQPHVENAILHGLRYLENKRGILSISMLITNDDCLEYILLDNGIGRKKSLEQKTYNNYTHKSYGLNITQNRIDLYNQKNKDHITFETIDLYNNNLESIGTKIIILIPIM